MTHFLRVGGYSVDRPHVDRSHVDRPHFSHPHVGIVRVPCPHIGIIQEDGRLPHVGLVFLHSPQVGLVHETQPANKVGKQDHFDLSYYNRPDKAASKPRLISLV